MKKILLVLLAVLVVLPLSVLPAGAKTASVTAADFDKIPVVTDLSGMTIGGIKFDPLKYAYNPLGDLQILTLLEYGYPDDPALYLYLYNPQDLALNTRDRRYAVTLALGDDPNYTKYPLKVLSTSGTDAHSRLWIKCRIDIGADKLVSKFKDKQERTYRLGEIELVVGDKVRAFSLGGEWTYSGTTAGGDLTSRSTMISVIELELHPLVYRGDRFSAQFEYDQVNSVYFSLPRDFEKKNGTVTSIRCTWTEYDSGWILACPTDKVRDSLASAAGKSVTSYTDAYPEVYLYLAPGAGNRFVFAWNVKDASAKITYDVDTLQWVVKYDGEQNELGAIVESDLQEQINAAWLAYNQGADNYFSQGGKVFEGDIMADQSFTVSVDSGASVWERIFLGKNTTEQSNRAFQRVTENALINPEAMLLVDQSYKKELTDALAKADQNEEDLMILHFASCDYNAIPVSAKYSSFRTEKDLYACREQLYMGFDILQITCEKNGEKVVVPVAAAPINVIGGLQFFSKIKDAPKWVIILIAILILAAIVILCPALLPILVKIVILPLRLLAWLLRAIGKGFAALFHKRE